MARARNIKPGFFTNGDLLECQPLARLLFAGLWCEADRRGILEDRPKTLKVKILPGDNCDVDELLEELSVRGFVVRYQVGESRCIYLPGFGKHQNPHVKETENTLPAPDGFDNSTGKAPVKNSTNRADSLLPITDSLKPIPPKSPKGDEVKPTLRSIKTPVPDDMEKRIPPDVWRTIGSEQRLSDTELKAETAKMVDHYLSKGERRADWTATWRSWMRSPYRKQTPLMTEHTNAARHGKWVG